MKQENFETEADNRLSLLRSRMQTDRLDAYIITAFEHQTELNEFSKSRLELITGLSDSGDAVVMKIKFNLKIVLWNEKFFQITAKSVAFWTEPKYLKIADHKLSCEWKLFSKSANTTISSLLLVSSCS